MPDWYKNVASSDWYKEHIEKKDTRKMKPIDDKIGSWLSAALSDENTCEEYKKDIIEWFESFEWTSDAGEIKPVIER